jgi:transcriptional regulator with XRE-family HTH domain
MNYTDFGLSILIYRKRTGLSQEALAEMAEISRNYLSMIERSEATNLSIDVLVRLARAMSVEPCQLLNILTGKTNDHSRPGA